MLFPLIGALMLTLVVVILGSWNDTPLQWLLGMRTPVLITSLVLGGLGSLLIGDFNRAVLAVSLLAAWVVIAGIRDLLDKTRHKGLFKGMRSLAPSYWGMHLAHLGLAVCAIGVVLTSHQSAERDRSEEHTSELQSLMRSSYAVFCLKNKNTNSRHFS